MRQALCCLLFLNFAISLPAQQKSEDQLRSDLSGAHTKGQIQDALNNLSGFYGRERRWTEQADTLKALVNFWESEMGPDSVGMARYSIELAQALERSGDSTAAEPYFRSGIAIYQKHGSMYAFAEQSARFSLSGNLRREGKLGEAEEIRASLPSLNRPKPPKPDYWPQVIAKQEPKYSGDARQHRVDGSVELSVMVDEKGRAQDVEVLKPLGFGLDENAIKTVKKWKFQPGMLNGSPVSVSAQIEVSFRLL